MAGSYACSFMHGIHFAWMIWITSSSPLHLEENWHWTGQGSLWLFLRALLAALLKPMQKVRKAQTKVSAGSRFISEGQQSLESDKAVAKKGSGEGKGLYCRLSAPVSAVPSLHPLLPSTLLGTDSWLVFSWFIST